MCLIIDNNVAHEIVQKSPDSQPIVDGLDKRKIMLATGGHHLQELLGNSIGRFLREMLRNGRAKNFSGDEIENKTEEFADNPDLKSDDPHVLALAMVSGARVLYTRDKNLMDDFKDRKLVAPKGSIYSTAKNRQLLSKCASC